MLWDSPRLGDDDFRGMHAIHDDGAIGKFGSQDQAALGIDSPDARFGGHDSHPRYGKSSTFPLFVKWDNPTTAAARRAALERSLVPSCADLPVPLFPD